MMNTIIAKAIKERQKLSFYYDGNFREFDPHVYGSTEKGNIVVLGIQTGGYSSSGNLPDWRMFELSKIQNISILEETQSTIIQATNPFKSKIQQVYISI